MGTGIGMFLRRVVDRYYPLFCRIKAKPEHRCSCIWKASSSSNFTMSRGYQALHQESWSEENRNMALFTDQHLSIEKGIMVTETWEASEDGWFKLNTDGSVGLNSGNATTRGLVRGPSGNWVFGYGKNIGTTSVLEAELQAIVDGIRMAWVKWVRRKGVLELEMEIRRWMTKDWKLNFKHVPQEANKAAYVMSKVARRYAVGLHIFTKPVLEVEEIIAREQCHTIECAISG
ncbi:hypothetical protein GOBAR_DD02298 [Gossypium barbadense]|nr:hypothetical protein GOBAR_DD02298 [Gossypium barbadense]